MDHVTDAVKIAFAGVLTGLTWLFGGQSILVVILLVLIVFDYITGMGAAVINGELKSKIGAKGIAKKVIILLLVSCGHLIDIAIGTTNMFVGTALEGMSRAGTNTVRDMVAGFYIINELVSLIENGGRLGVPVPKILLKVVAAFRDKPEKEEM